MPTTRGQSTGSKPERDAEGAIAADVRRDRQTEATNKRVSGQWHIDVGVDVVGSCGHKVGEVVDVRDDYVVVEKGFFRPEDFFVPKSAIDSIGDHSVKLNVSRDDLAHSGWNEDPDDNS